MNRTLRSRAAAVVFLSQPAEGLFRRRLAYGMNETFVIVVERQKEESAVVEGIEKDMKRKAIEKQ